MFERYTEAARKSVFYARYEASASGSTEIEPVHLLLGVVHSDEELVRRVFGSVERIDAIRQRFVKPAKQPGPPLNVDLPLTQEAKRALAYATEESERMDQTQIGTAHMLVGLIRVEKTPAWSMLREMGVTLNGLRREAARIAEAPPPPKQAKAPEIAALLSRLRTGLRVDEMPDCSVDLTAAASEDHLDPLIGRDGEMERILQILLRRYRNWVALTGEPGVGKTAVLRGLAQRIVDGAAHAVMGGRRVISIHAALLPGPRDLCEGLVILCVEGLFDQPAEEAMRTVRMLQSQAHRSDARIIATGTPQGFRGLSHLLAREFELVELLPPTEAETIRILAGLKEKYEKFHGVSIGEEAIAAAVKLSRRFLSNRLLPDRAIDLLDDACATASVKGNKEITPAEIQAAAAARTGAKGPALGAEPGEPKET